VKKALLLIDIQNDYFKGGASELIGSDIAAENAKKLLLYFRAHHLPIVHIQHLSTRSGATYFIPDTYGAEIHKTVTPLPNEQLIIKSEPNSFSQTALLTYLESLAINELVIAGMMTHMCVDATVRAAKDFGFSITLAGDACATKNLVLHNESIAAASVHLSFLAALNYFYATVLDTDVYLENQRK